MNLDQKSREDFTKNPSSCIVWYLMSSYAYYKLDVSLLKDETFDNMCKWMLNNWDKISHKYKHLVDKESLSAGTGFDIEFNRFPDGLIRVINKLIKEVENM